MRLQTTQNELMEERDMYTTDDRGILNNYALEPAMSYTEYPSQDQQRQYALQGAVATLIVSALVLIALSVS